MDTSYPRARLDDFRQRPGLEDLCRRWHLSELSFFGSVTRADFSSGSDVDVIVDFTSGHTPGFAFARLVSELEAMFGRPVDVLTRRGLDANHTRVAQHIKETAVPVYERPPQI